MVSARNRVTFLSLLLVHLPSTIILTTHRFFWFGFVLFCPSSQHQVTGLQDFSYCGDHRRLLVQTSWSEQGQPWGQNRLLRVSSVSSWKAPGTEAAQPLCSVLTSCDPVRLCYPYLIGRNRRESELPSLKLSYSVTSNWKFLCKQKPFLRKLWGTRKQ